MAGKSRSVFVCGNCGASTAKWYGKCSSCNEWNTISEEPIMQAAPASKTKTSYKQVKAVSLEQISGIAEARYMTGLKEFDRVLGGGIVKGSLALLSGDPGIGKSTILLQVCETLSCSLKILYVSGEESERQLKLRADRLGVKSENLLVMSEVDIESICEYIKSAQPNLVIIDSIQTMNHNEVTSSPGSVTQVRECTNLLHRTAKTLDIPVLIVGHVNKDGNIAGPKVLEHIVDAVLYFEGERHLSYRILRAVKNRYGSTNEIGVFEMRDAGLFEVENPSMMLLSGRPKNASGTCVTCVMEGSRPILAEIQCLVSPTGFGNPRRMSTGFDIQRMLLLLAVLEKRAGYFFSNMDAYLNVVGGLRIDQPAADLSVALAMISSLKDTPIREDVLAFGEGGLAGEIRAVGQIDMRVNEAARLGFSRCIVPRHSLKSISPSTREIIDVVGARNIREAYEVL